MNVQKIGSDLINSNSKYVEMYKETITSTPLCREMIAGMAKKVVDAPVPFNQKVADFFLNMRIKSLEKRMIKNINDIKKYVELEHKAMKLKAKLSSTVKNIAKSIYESFSK